MNTECWEVDGNHKMEGLSHSVELSTFRGAPIKVVIICTSVCVLVLTVRDWFQFISIVLLLKAIIPPRK